MHIGKVLHELKAQKGKNTELSIDHIKIDKLTEDYLVEVKKSDADLNAVTWQVLYYLSILKNKGIERKGKIEVIERMKEAHKIHYVELTEEKEIELTELTDKIKELINQDSMPAPIDKPTCKKCAYFEYCYI